MDNDNDNRLQDMLRQIANLIARSINDDDHEGISEHYMALYNTISKTMYDYWTKHQDSISVQKAMYINFSVLASQIGHEYITSGYLGVPQDARDSVLRKFLDAGKREGLERIKSAVENREHSVMPEDEHKKMVQQLENELNSLN